MKKALFCYDGPIMKDNNNNYYGNEFDDKVLKRYEYIAENIKLLMRVKKINEDVIEKKFSKINTEKYDVGECLNLSSIKGLLFNRKIVKKQLENEIRQANYVIVRLPSIIGSLSIGIAKKLNKPYFVELVGCPWDALWNHSIKGKLFAPIMTLNTKRLVKNAPFVLYVTEEFLQRRYPTEGKSVGCSDVILKESNNNIIEDRKKHILENQNTEKKIIATIGAINVKFKGQKYVIKAINKLKKHGINNYEYWIIGGGDKSYLEKFVKKYKLENNVKFLGSLPHDEIFNKLEKVDIYIQPSKQEGLPRSLLEAMSMGCLSIGANTGGIPELLDKEYIVRRGNVNDIVEKIKSITIEQQIEQAKVNFEKSKKYEKAILEEKRNSFYDEFINSTNEIKKEIK